MQGFDCHDRDFVVCIRFTAPYIYLEDKSTDLLWRKVRLEVYEKYKRTILVHEAETVYDALEAFEVEVLPYIRDYARELLDKAT
jgi:hypothetical protein